MRLPRIEWPITQWDSRLIERWTALESKAAEMSEAAGSNDAFDSTVAELRNMASTGQFGNLIARLKRRIVARALTWLWLNDANFTSKMLNPSLLNTLEKAQEPRFTRMTLQQLAQLYFRRFDLLDTKYEVRELLERILSQQLEKISPLKIQSTWVDPLVTLKRESSWLLNLDGPATLARRVQEEGRELGETFQELGLQGFDDGRYGDMCRTHFYLDTLRNLPLGASDPVFSELLKPLVHMAPFEGSRRIGHVALEILIDRAQQDLSEVWQDFIINLAGDPRIASSARNYREWWQPLGEMRIQKVRAWLSKEDLRLFLRALEQYGFESGNDELQRMFPARKTFLEGLFRLKLIRSTRLLLGDRARQAVKKILDKDVNTSFASMDGQMNDKAVIYLDCGDFHLIEGSHSFKIWVYFAAPSELLRSYEQNHFSHADLTKAIPNEYQKNYPQLPFDSFVHSPNTWQNNVFNFLASNGIELDVEQLLSPQDYQYELSRFGLPVVNRTIRLDRTAVNKPPEVTSQGTRKQSLGSTSEEKRTTNSFSASSRPPRRIIKVPSSLEATSKPRVSSLPMTTSASRDNISSVAADEPSHLPLELIGTNKQAPDSESTSRTHNSTSTIPHLDSMELQVLRYFNDNPGDKARDAADVLNTETGKVYHVLCNALKALCRKDKEHGWHLTDSARLELDGFEQAVISSPVVSELSITAGPAKQTPNTKPTSRAHSCTPRLSRLDSLDLQVLRYFNDNPGDKARDAADILNTETGKVYHVLCNALKVLCRKDKEHGWQPTDSARLELKIFDGLLRNKNSESSRPIASSTGSRISRLTPLELRVLRYFYDNPNDKARHAATVLNIERADVNRVLYSALRGLCRQGTDNGWRLTDTGRLELDVFDQQG